MDWSSGKTLLRQALDWNSGKTLLKQMTNRIKFWGGNNATLDYALQKEKETQNLASRFAATKTEGRSSYAFKLLSLSSLNIFILNIHIYPYFISVFGNTLCISNSVTENTYCVYSIMTGGFYSNVQYLTLEQRRAKQTVFPNIW